MKKIILIVLSTFLLTGCYNYHELENLGIASSILIDYQNEYEVTIEIVEDELPKTFNGKGPTLTASLEDALLGIEKDLAYNHINVLFITENVDIKEVLLFFLRNPDINNTFYLVLTETTDIYGDEDMGKKVFEILKRNKANSFFEIIRTIYDNKIDMTLAYLDKDLYLSKLMAFDELKPSYLFSLPEIELYRILTERPDTYVKSSCDGGFYTILLNEIKTDTKVNNKIEINVELEATITEFNCKLDMTDIKDIQTSENTMNKKLTKDISQFIDTLKVKNSDIFGFNQLIQKKNHNLKKDWLDYDYDVKVSTHINKKGLMLK